MTDTIESKMVGDTFRVRIKYDGHPSSPREDENGSHFFTAHRRYASPDRYTGSMLRAIREAVWPKGDYPAGVDEAVEGDDLWTLMKHVTPRAVWLKVYGYEHGGIVYRAASAEERNPFLGRAQHAEWDSGFAGIILMTLEAARECMMVKRLSPKARAQVVANLQGEVDTYSDFVNGHVYGYIVERVALDEDGDVIEDEVEEVDSCWGYYGIEDTMAEGVSSAEYYVEADAEGLTAGRAGLAMIADGVGA